MTQTTQNMTANQSKLIDTLAELFQLDRSDLDFGIYRIMNTKATEITQFLENDLLSSVAEAFSDSDTSSIQKKLDEAIAQARSLGADPQTLPKVIELTRQLSVKTPSKTKEDELFSHMAVFFRRYYKDGDFVSMRRYKKDTYAIPYEGEEVKLHWANSDQYYIKSGEYFRDYVFKIGDKTIHLKLNDAQTSSDNNKPDTKLQRRFVIVADNPSEMIADELYINFEYIAIASETQDNLNEQAIAKALESIEDLKFTTALNTPAPTKKNKSRTLFEKHMKSYTSRNSFDYFIHKDLGGFLSREMDFYIKNEMLYLDDIMDSAIKYEEVMDTVRVFRKLSQKIINFLTQLEELQKKLWEKKKFVIETNYCITLDKIPQKYFEKIFKNQEQLKEWKALFGSEALASQQSYSKAIQGGTKVPLLDDLRYLVLDTKFFDTKFKYQLLSEFDNLDETIDGVLINSENFGALNLLQHRYKEQIKTVYIDPPYNTGNDGFLYNDNFQHSSWMSFMFDRLTLGRELMSDDGVIFSSIDDVEVTNLSLLKNNIFGSNNFIAKLIFQSNSIKNNAKQVSTVHEYCSVYVKDIQKQDNWRVILANSRKLFDFFSDLNNELNNNEKTILIKKFIRQENITGSLANYTKIDKIGLYRLDNIGGVKNGNLEMEIFHPITLKPCKKTNGGWRYNDKKIKELLDKDLIYFGKDEGSVPQIKRYLDKKHEAVFNSVIYKDTSQDSKKIDRLFGQNKLFDFPKNVDFIKELINLPFQENNIILDFFAGSGTTGHAVISLNREDKGRRKYILVEMGEYFDTVTKPRIQKVIYSDSWKDGKPTNTDGISQMFKYFCLESYEDTLNNLEFKKTKEQKKALDLYPQARQDYMLNYSLDIESQGSLLDIDEFAKPFDYKLKVATSSVGQTKDTAIDLVETFNYLLGLVVKQIKSIDGFVVIEGQNLKDDKILIIWRDGQSSDDLEKFFTSLDWQVFDREFDLLYVNGDNSLEGLKTDDDFFKVKLIEQEFGKLMFDE